MIVYRVLLVLDEWTPDNGLVTAAFKIRRWVYYYYIVASSYMYVDVTNSS